MKTEQGHVEMPFLILSKEEFDAKTAHRKPKPGRSFGLDDVRDPSTPVALAKTSGIGGGVVTTSRRGHVLCVVYGPEELEGIFGIKSEYGGMVCTRH